MSLTVNETVDAPPGEPSLQDVDAIDAIDDEIISLVALRARLVQQKQRARIAAGAPGTRLSRENQVIHRYSHALGRTGAEIALKIVDLCRYRGRAG